MRYLFELGCRQVAIEMGSWEALLAGAAAVQIPPKQAVSLSK
jgi:hypothetical protein